MQDLETLYQLYSQDIYRYLYSLTHDPHWSEDLLSETFLKAVRGFSSFEKRSSIKTLLFMIACNVWIDSLRRKRPCLSSDDLLANYIEDESPSSERLEEDCANRELIERITHSANRLLQKSFKCASRDTPLRRFPAPAISRKAPHARATFVPETGYEIF